MDQRPLGRTGLSTSVLAFGAFKIGRNEGIKYPTGYALPDDDAVRALLDGVLALGINLIDTAPAYGASEERIGRALAGRRGEYLLSTKAGETFEGGRSRHDFSAGALRASVERSLRRLRTEAVDVLLVHSDGEDRRVLEETDAVETMLALRTEGCARAVGFSGKTTAGARAALDWADVIMVEYHLDDRSHEAVMAAAAERGVGVLVKKALASGRLDPAAALPFALAPPGVSSVVVGGLSLEHLREDALLVARRGAPERGRPAPPPADRRR